MSVHEAADLLRVEWAKLREHLDAGILDQEQIHARTAYFERVLDQLESAIADNEMENGLEAVERWLDGVMLPPGPRMSLAAIERAALDTSNA